MESSMNRTSVFLLAVSAAAMLLASGCSEKRSVAPLASENAAADEGGEAAATDELPDSESPAN